MKLYLTSSHVGTYRGEAPSYQGLNPANGLVEELKRDWMEGRCLQFASSPDAYECNDWQRADLERILIETGLKVSCVHLCDGRNPEIVDKIGEYDFVFLSGGHVPTENAFFHALRLKERLKGFEGIVMGVSAGSMNCASLVYAQPELEGETSPCFRRWIEGLGLTEINVLPHYQACKDDVVDGKRVFEDVAYPDSFVRPMIAIPDGSFLLQREGIEVLHGIGYRIQNGRIEEIHNL